MKKFNLRYFKYYNNEISFKEGINYIIGPNASGKTTLLKYIQYALGLNNISINKNIITPIEIEFTLDNDKFHFYREFDSNVLIAETSNGSYEINPRTNDYYDFLVEIFQPDCDLNENKQIKYLINEIFYSPEIKNRISNRYLSYLMLGIDQKYENDIQNKINHLSEDLKEKEKSINILSEYKNEVLNSIEQVDRTNIEFKMDDIFNKYKTLQLADYELLDKSKALLHELKVENKHRIENIIEYLDFQYSKYDLSQNRYLFDDIESIFMKKSDYISVGEKTYNEICTRLLLQANYHRTNGIGALFNDYNLHFDKSTLIQIRNIAKRISSDTGLQYIEFTHSDHNIDENRIVYRLNQGYSNE